MKLSFESGRARESTDCKALLSLRLKVVPSRGKKQSEPHYPLPQVLRLTMTDPSDAAMSPEGTTACRRHPKGGKQIGKTAGERRHGAASLGILARLPTHTPFPAIPTMHCRNVFFDVNHFFNK